MEMKMKKNKTKDFSQYGSFLLSDKRNVPFAVLEAFNALRTNLSYALSTSERKSFIITSTEASEGKSTVAINSAIAFSEMKSKVLLIDADMRSPVVHSRLSLKQSKGLSGLLAGFFTSDECIQAYNDYMDVIPAGEIAPNPSELLASLAMKSLLSEMEKHYDYIIVDTPPCNVVTDALVFAHETAGVAIAVRENYTVHPMLERLLEQMEFANVKVLGIILNDAGADGRAYGKYGHYGKYRKYGKYSKYGYYGNDDHPENDQASHG
ncbi:MAG TPA: CpsD/CapB family tyrosine-protein kinase [Clostridiales bacterium]|nr:CpsD/CapB family tyrosine-protein kinase [Clostridiales bacterium]